MPVTEQQARALTFLAASIRPTGARRWDEAGIYANIMKVADRSLAAVAIAVVQAAEDRNAQSPGVIPTAGPHWRNPESAPGEDRVPYDPGKVCHDCGHRQGEHGTADHAFRSVEAVRAIRSSPAPKELREAIAAEPRIWPQRDAPPAPAAAVARQAHPTGDEDA